MSEKLSEEEIQRLLKWAEKHGSTIKGYSPSAHTKDGKRIIGFEKNRPGTTPGWHNPGAITTDAYGWELDDLKKRTQRERVEALTGKLWQGALKNPAAMEILLQKLQAHFWKQGRTVTIADVRTVAEDLIKQAERDQEAGR